MLTGKPGCGRHMSKSLESDVARRLRGQIACGRFGGGGQRLPPRSVLAAEFNTSQRTVQEAMVQLEAEGFVRTGARRLGTVVAEHPPCLRHYGLLFPCKPTPEKPWPRNWQAIDVAARKHLDKRPSQLVKFYEGDIQQNLASHRAFLDEVVSHRLAGLIVPALPVPHLADLIASGGGTFPIVAGWEGILPGLTTIRYKGSAAPRMLDYLASRGRRRLGQLVPGAWFEDANYEARFLRPLPERGMRCEPRWIQVILPQAPQGVRNAAELLASIPDGPDAIIVHDDNAVQEVIDGIRAAGKRIPEDIELVVWGNFPWPESYTAPVKRFGVNMEQLILLARRHIDARRRGEAAADAVLEPEEMDETEAGNRKNKLEVTS